MSFEVENLPSPPRPVWPLVALLLGAIGGTACVVYAAHLLVKPATGAPTVASSQSEMMLDHSGPRMSTPFVWPGIQQPPTSPAAEAQLADEAEVIGVSAGGKHRAYALQAFNGPKRHVVNDLLGGVPVSVTYCDVTHCARVFTDKESGQPLSLQTGGFAQGKLLLHLNDRFYQQDTGRCLSVATEVLPFAEQPFVRTTWKAWKVEHPDSDVYVASPEDAGLSPTPVKQP